MRKVFFALAAAGFMATSAPALAAPCRDAHGKFTKCPAAKAKPVRCKDAHGKFAKCGIKGAKPA
jgi:hypothetical protein